MIFTNQIPDTLLLSVSWNQVVSVDHLGTYKVVDALTCLQRNLRQAH